MGRKTNAMRVRRRQSDAKWRASVASCYNTLKMITSFPQNSGHKKNAKRKISKAYILQESEKHITFLEDILSMLLAEKAKLVEKKLVVGKEEMAQQLKEVKADFSAKQLEIFSQCGTGKKQYSVSADKYTDFFGLDSESTKSSESEEKYPPKICHKTTTKEKKKGKACVKIPETERQLTIHPAMLSLDNPIKMAEQSAEEHKFVLKSPIPVKLHKATAKRRVSTSKESQRTESTKVNQVKRESAVPQRTRASVEELSSEWSQAVHVTPDKCLATAHCDYLEENNTYAISGSKLIIRQLPCGSPLLTPLKSQQKLRYDQPVHGQTGIPASQTVPYWSGTEDSVSTFGLESDCNVDENEVQLLCEESIDSVDLEDNLTLPSSKDTRSKPKDIEDGATCCRKLDKFFSDDDNQKLPQATATPGMFTEQDTGCLDFDGYFLFYQHIANQWQLNEKEMNSISKLWQNMTNEQRNTLVTLATLDNFDEGHMYYQLTDDLKDIDIKEMPLLDKGSLFMKATKVAPVQIVPELDFNIFKDETDLSSPPEEVSVVPECELSADTVSTELHLDKSSTFTNISPHTIFDKQQEWTPYDGGDVEAKDLKMYLLDDNLYGASDMRIISENSDCGQLVPEFEP